MHELCRKIIQNRGGNKFRKENEEKFLHSKIPTFYLQSKFICLVWGGALFSTFIFCFHLWCALNDSEIVALRSRTLKFIKGNVQFLNHKLNVTHAHAVCVCSWYIWFVNHRICLTTLCHFALNLLYFFNSFCCFSDCFATKCHSISKEKCVRRVTY